MSSPVSRGELRSRVEEKSARHPTGEELCQRGTGLRNEQTRHGLSLGGLSDRKAPGVWYVVSHVWFLSDDWLTMGDRVLELPTISNRHCIIFNETKDGKNVAILEDLSSNGTFVNEAIVGRNKRRELEHADQISVLDQARFMFYYTHNRDRNAFRQQYRILNQLGKGHFATVYLCVERTTGMQYAVKRFEKRPGDDRSRAEGLQQEIGVLRSVSHPNMLCLKDCFDEDDGIYLVLELAPEGELFNYIVMNQKLTEGETRKIFVQLFQGIKYLVIPGLEPDCIPSNSTC